MARRALIAGFRSPGLRLPQTGQIGQGKIKGSMAWLSMAVDDCPRNSNFRNGLAAFQQSSGKNRVPWTIDGRLAGRLADCELRKLGKPGKPGRSDSKIRKLGRPVHLRTILGLQMARSAQFGKSAAGFAQSAASLRHRLGKSRRDGTGRTRNWADWADQDWANPKLGRSELLARPPFPRIRPAIRASGGCAPNRSSGNDHPSSGFAIPIPPASRPACRPAGKSCI